MVIGICLGSIGFGGKQRICPPFPMVSWYQAGHHRFAHDVDWSGTETPRHVPIQGHICTRLSNGAALLAFHSSALDHMPLCDELRILDIWVCIC